MSRRVVLWCWVCGSRSGLVCVTFVVTIAKHDLSYVLDCSGANTHMDSKVLTSSVVLSGG